jgi:hypothetical protein
MSSHARHTSTLTPHARTLKCILSDMLILNTKFDSDLSKI